MAASRRFDMGKASDRIKNELIACEERLYDNAVRSNPLKIAEILDLGCIEILLNGKQNAYKPGEVFMKLEGVHYIDSDNAKLIDLADDCKLLSYIGSQVVKNVRTKSNRCSIWKKIDGTWKIVFHQGTPLTE
jgi:hypothetical protein